MKQNSHNTVGLLEAILEHIDIPKSLYEKAAYRHRALGEWLKRDSSAVRHFKPDIRPQGSFRFGTVTSPINKDDEYDLDNVCVLTLLTKGDLTQQQLKKLYGNEIKAYARENGMNAPVEECNRCWRLRYADEVSFHLDTLPCVPEEAAVIRRLMVAGVPEELAKRAVAITDCRHPHYEEVTRAWLSSNPRGFAAWFEERAALGRPIEPHCCKISSRDELKRPTFTLTSRCLCSYWQDIRHSGVSHRSKRARVRTATVRGGRLDTCRRVPADSIWDSGGIVVQRKLCPACGIEVRVDRGAGRARKSW